LCDRPRAEEHRRDTAYEKAGFRFFKTIQVPGEPEPEYLMRLTRGEFEGGGLG
jgi:hypothetical protein